MCIILHFSGNWTETTTGPDGTKQVRNYKDGLLYEAISYGANSTTALQKTTFGYNALGQMTTQTECRDESTTLTTTMTYYLGGQLLKVLTPYDTANDTGGTFYTRDVLGRETSVRLSHGWRFLSGWLVAN